MEKVPEPCPCGECRVPKPSASGRKFWGRHVMLCFNFAWGQPVKLSHNSILWVFRGSLQNPRLLDYPLFIGFGGITDAEWQTKEIDWYPEGKKRVPNTVHNQYNLSTNFVPVKKTYLKTLPGFYHPARPVCLGEFSQRSCGVQFASGWACPSILSMETSWRATSTSLASPGKIVECYLDSLCSRGHLLLNWDWWDCLKGLPPALKATKINEDHNGSIWNSYGIINFSLIVKEMNLRQWALMVGGLQYRIILVWWSLKTSLQRHTWLLTAYIIILVQCYTVLYSYVPIYTTTKWLSTNALSSSSVSRKKRQPRLLQCFTVAVRNSGLGIRKLQLMRRGVVQRSLPPAMVVGQPISAPVPNPHSGAACGLGCLVPMLVGRVNAVIHWTVKVLKLIFIVKDGVFFETCWATLLFIIFLGTKICLDINLKP